MTTYSDMVTLLLAFFIMLFAFSNLDIERFRAIMTSFQGSLGVLDSGATLIRRDSVYGGQEDIAMIVHRTPMEVLETQELLQNLAHFQRQFQLDASFAVDVTERGVVIHFTDGVLFDLGSAELRADARTVLKGLAGVLAGWPYHIRVEGHTDNWPIDTVRYPSNWELSTARASRVVRFFVDEGGLPPARLSAAGYGEYRPIAPNDSVEGRSKNRRVDIVLLSHASTASEPTARLEP